MASLAAFEPNAVGPVRERLRRAQPVADVAQVAQGAGQVAFEDVGVQVLAACRLRTALTKLPKWSPPPVNSLDHLAVVGVGDAAGVARADDEALAAVPDVADEVGGFSPPLRAPCRGTATSTAGRGPRRSARSRRSRSG